MIQAAGSTFQARLFNLGSDYGRVAYYVQLDGEGAHADLSGLYFGFGEQTLDQQITVVHSAKNCTSRQSYRGVLDDSARWADRIRRFLRLDLDREKMRGVVDKNLYRNRAS